MARFDDKGVSRAALTQHHLMILVFTHEPGNFLAGRQIAGDQRPQGHQVNSLLLASRCYQLAADIGQDHELSRQLLDQVGQRLVKDRVLSRVKG